MAPSPVIPSAGSSFSPVQKMRLVAEIALAYPQALYLMRRRELRAAVAGMRRVAHPHATPAGDARVIGARLGRAVMRVLSVVPTDARCLVRSLVLTRLLARRGISHSLVIGARTEPRFGAHAWIEHEGVELLPGADPAMERLVEV